MADRGEDYNAEPTFPAKTTPEGGRARTFKDLQDSIDEQTWIGRACIEKLPRGGGNFEK